MPERHINNNNGERRMNIFNEDNLCSHCTFEHTCEFHNEKPNHAVIFCDEYQMEMEDI